jgi:hypothetical protein
MEEFLAIRQIQEIASQRNQVVCKIGRQRLSRVAIQHALPNISDIEHKLRNFLCAQTFYYVGLVYVL